MKRLYYILAIAGALYTSSPLHAQEDEQTQQRKTPRASQGARTQENKNTGLPELSVRAQDMNERMTQDIGNARWMRVMYREIDLTKDKNAPLYYPVRPMNGSMNLFSIIFQLMSEGKIIAYEYKDGYESFDDANKSDFKVVLDRARIYYDEVPGKVGAEPTFVINESDIPSGDVKSYYVKEAWYFDQNNSVFDVKTLAICPILTVGGDMGDERMALFWLPYENIRPYITNSLIMTSNVNNAKTFSMDDYFRRRMFDGEIIKTENLMNKTLKESYPDPDSLLLAQKQIEGQLETFQKSLYWEKDTTQAAVNSKGKKSQTKAKTERVAKVSEKKEAKPKAAKAPKAEKSSAPARSVRRR